MVIKTRGTENGDNNAEAKYGKLNIPKDDDTSTVWSLREFGEEDDGAQQRKHSVSSAGPRVMLTSPSEICEDPMELSFSQAERRLPTCRARGNFHMPTRPQAPLTPYDSYRQHSADGAASYQTVHPRSSPRAVFCQGFENKRSDTSSRLLLQRPQP
ncbi:hypothetical protein CGCSCA1_v012754 [Colletotrichum siamense]|nr:hypothetical protein CGCSCA1_v012754 [Colletotrichum siamense]